MNLNLGEILDPVAPNVGDAGACVASDRDKIVDYINRAQRLLIHRLDSKGTVWPRCVPVCAEVFALPPEFLEVRSVLVDGRPAVQRDQYFEGNAHIGHRHDNHLLEAAWQHYCEGRELFDLGDLWATPTLLPQVRGAHLALAAQQSSDANKQISVQILNGYGDWITETITLDYDQKKVFSLSECYDVRAVVKPITDGNVTLFLVSPDGCYTIQALYGPKVTNPSYRRKRLPRRGRKSHDCPSIVKIMGKLRFCPALSDSDPLVIGNLDAIIWAVKAVTAQTIGDVKSYTEFLDMAVMELLHELRDDESEVTVSPVEVRTGVRFNPCARARYWR